MTTKPGSEGEQRHPTCPSGHSRSFTQFTIGLYECHDCTPGNRFLVQSGKSKWCDDIDRASLPDTTGGPKFVCAKCGGDEFVQPAACTPAPAPLPDAPEQEDTVLTPTCPVCGGHDLSLIQNKNHGLFVFCATPACWTFPVRATAPAAPPSETREVTSRISVGHDYPDPARYSIWTPDGNYLTEDKKEIAAEIEHRYNSALAPIKCPYCQNEFAVTQAARASAPTQPAPAPSPNALPLKIYNPRTDVFQVVLQFGPHCFTLLEYERRDTAESAVKSIQENWRIRSSAPTQAGAIADDLLNDAALQAEFAVFLVRLQDSDIDRIDAAIKAGCEPYTTLALSLLNIVRKYRASRPAPSLAEPPFETARRLLMGQMWSQDEAAALHEIVSIGTAPSRRGEREP